MDILSTIFSGAAIAAIVGLVEVLIKHHWDKKDKRSGVSAQLATIEQKLSEHIEADERYKAETKRARILQFNKEIREGERHTEEEWIEILKVIDEYEDYCKTHKEFPNNRAGAAISNAKSTYEKANKDNDFAT